MTKRASVVVVVSVSEVGGRRCQCLGVRGALAKVVGGGASPGAGIFSGDARRRGSVCRRRRRFHGKLQDQDLGTV